MAREFGAFVLSWFYSDYGEVAETTIGVFRSVAAAEAVRDAITAAIAPVVQRHERLQRWAQERVGETIYIPSERFWEKCRPRLCADLSWMLACDGAPAIQGFRLYRSARAFLAERSA